MIYLIPLTILMPKKFLSATSCASDANQDGIADIVVGSVGNDDGYSDTGAFYVIFLTTSGSVSSFQKISATSGSFTAG